MTSYTSNSMLTNDMTDCLPFLLGLFAARDWTVFEGFVLSNPETFTCISKSIYDCGEFNGMTLLHACVRFDPPVSVLKKMIKLHPQALRREDCIGRTPLHIAAGSGASSLVTKILTVHYPDACNIQDEDGRTPLHLACDAFCELFEENDDISSPRGPPSRDTVCALLSGSLDAVVLEDADEMNAVEYALLSDAPIEVVTLLQQAMQRVMRRNQSKMIPSPRSCPATTIMSRIVLRSS